MRIEDQLRDRLKKVEALYFGAATAGERDAAEAAAELLKAKLEEVNRRDPPIEMKFSLPDQWSVRLFIARAGVMASGRSDIRGSARRRSWSGRRAAFSTPWCGGSFPTCLLIPLDVAMRHVRNVIRLKSAGMPTREIAWRVGKAPSTVRLTVDDPPVRGGGADLAIARRHHRR
ncbi:hypothetical protein ABIF14_001733 [Bradyrhizobium elkanii]|nr:hypothetical protein [Bradyrhizobium elkanii]MCP1976103.1 hypothetical protein [Bradyrhizobium elkanii]MCS3693296.1 hypothetical protein [Bradyrhizobium elkanii]MCS3889380.1 hypothetical protein [Bradyrhizobium elkanii]MCS4211599.1 hypothetical protein [Bradyrhizobium elkanii]